MFKIEPNPHVITTTCFHRQVKHEMWNSGVTPRYTTSPFSKLLFLLNGKTSAAFYVAHECTRTCFTIPLNKLIFRESVSIDTFIYQKNGLRPL